MKFTLLLMSVLLTVACEKKSTSVNIDNEDRQETSLVNGKSATDYFNQFIYRTSTKKDKETGKETKFFHYLVGGSFKDKAKLTEDIYASIEIAMNKDGTFKYEYSEKKKEYNSTSGSYGSYYNGLLAVTGSGKWSVDRSKLILEGIGEATGVMVGDSGISSSTSSEGKDGEKPGVILSFSQDLKRKGLKGQTVVLTMSSTWSSSGKSPVDGWKDYDNSKSE